MEKIFLSKRLRQYFDNNKKQIETQLDVNLSIEGRYLIVNTKKDAYSEYIAVKVLNALNMGFDLDVAFALTNPNFSFELLDIRKGLKPGRLREVTARVIGGHGKTLQTLSKLSDCTLIFRNNVVGIIGESVGVNLVVHALNSLIRGAPHSHIYKFIIENKGKVYESEVL